MIWSLGQLCLFWNVKRLLCVQSIDWIVSISWRLIVQYRFWYRVTLIFGRSFLSFFCFQILLTGRVVDIYLFQNIRTSMEMTLIWLFRVRNFFKINIIHAKESWRFVTFLVGLIIKSRLFTMIIIIFRMTICWLLLLIFRQTWKNLFNFRVNLINVLNSRVVLSFVLSFSTVLVSIFADVWSRFGDVCGMLHVFMIHERFLHLPHLTENAVLFFFDVHIVHILEGKRLRLSIFVWSAVISRLELPIS